MVLIFRGGGDVLIGKLWRGKENVLAVLLSGLFLCIQSFQKCFYQKVMQYGFIYLLGHGSAHSKELYANATRIVKQLWCLLFHFKRLKQ